LRFLKIIFPQQGDAMSKPPTVFFPDRIPDTKMIGTYEKERPLHLLQEDFRVIIDGQEFTLKAGIVFDFASVPRPFWSLVPPMDPKYAGASLLHDVGYGAEIWPRKYCDDLFLAAMITSKVKRWKRQVMYYAVRVGGRFTYKNHTKASIKKIRVLLGVPGMKRPEFEAGEIPNIQGVDKCK
jgi:hypothetical protein